MDWPALIKAIGVLITALANAAVKITEIFR
jgi:hypothetical protein